MKPDCLIFCLLSLCQLSAEALLAQLSTSRQTDGRSGAQLWRNRCALDGGHLSGGVHGFLSGDPAGRGLGGGEGGGGAGLSEH